MISRKSSYFGQIGPLTQRLSALEQLKQTTQYTCNGENGVFTINRVLLILAGNENMH